MVSHTPLGRLDFPGSSGTVKTSLLRSNLPTHISVILSRIHLFLSLQSLIHLYWTSGHAWTSVSHLNPHTPISIIRTHMHSFQSSSQCMQLPTTFVYMHTSLVVVTHTSFSHLYRHIPPFWSSGVGTTLLGIWLHIHLIWLQSKNLFSLTHARLRSR